MHNIYHIAIMPRAGVTEEEVTAVMNVATDWLQYHSNCYMIWTNSNAKKWYERLRPLVNPGGSLVICRVDVSDFFGFANKAIWTWLDEHKEKMKKQG